MRAVKIFSPRTRASLSVQPILEIIIPLFFTFFSYVLVDLGGGTADISVQKVETYSKKTQVVQFSEAHPPTGGPWGGRLVNYAFEDRVLRPFLGKEKFAEYKRSPLRFLFMQPFERMKTVFTILF